MEAPAKGNTTAVPAAVVAFLTALLQRRKFGPRAPVLPIFCLKALQGVVVCACAALQHSLTQQPAGARGCPG